MYVMMCAFVTHTDIAAVREFFAQLTWSSPSVSFHLSTDTLREMLHAMETHHPAPIVAIFWRLDWQKFAKLFATSGEAALLYLKL